MVLLSTRSMSMLRTILMSRPMPETNRAVSSAMPVPMPESHGPVSTIMSMGLDMGMSQAQAQAQT